MSVDGLRCILGATENARHEFAAPVCTGGNCGTNFARVENAGKVSMESQSVKKCLKVVVGLFVCTVIPSV